MDSDAIDRAGLTPLQPELAAIRRAGDRAEFARLMGSVEGSGTPRQPMVRAEPGGFLLLGRRCRPANPARYALYVGQAGLILPGPEYYTQAEFADIRSGYQAYVADALPLIGWNDPDQAPPTRPARDRNRQGQLLSRGIARSKATDHRMSLAQLEKAAPGFPWAEFLRGAGVPAGTRRHRCSHVDRDIAAIYARTPLDTLRAKQAFGAATSMRRGSIASSTRPTPASRPPRWPVSRRARTATSTPSICSKPRSRTR